MEITIPAEVYTRLATVQTYPHEDMTPWFHSLRYENGLLIASNRVSIVVQRVGGPEGIVHLSCDPEMLTVLHREVKFSSKVHVTVVPMLKYASLKTTLGYVYPGNVAVHLDGPNDLDRWRSMVPTETPKKSSGGWLFTARSLAMLAEVSPSGVICAPEHINGNQAMIVRDQYDENWFAVFIPGPGPKNSDPFEPAKLPRWWK